MSFLGAIQHPEYRGIVGTLVKKYRKEQKWTAAALAQTLGYATGDLNASRGNGLDNLESGKNDPGMGMLFKMCEVLGPDFVDDLADEMFAVAKRGLEMRRDRKLEEARAIANEVSTRKRRERPKTA